MPLVTIKTGIAAPDGREEELTEYLCDWPHCPNAATQVMGVVRDPRMAAAVCDTHATKASAVDGPSATGSSGARA